MKQGYTLLELLVVVIIIAVLAAVALPQYFNAVENTRMVELKIMWGHQKNWAIGKQLSDADVAKTNESMQKYGLKYFTGEIVCRTQVSDGQPCFEVVFTRKPNAQVQYQITTVNNFRDLACIPAEGNLLGSRFCKSRMRPDGETTIDGKTAYLIH
ncbi:MAG: prepilin-type N-terminal cleavage/methylation domain-containing protein [Elusimicrobiaceae bacterium]|nr:prepilin-type N-terminal cleavage/methylation domain-containing protein [Elusimicrobiaceae bacterium]